MRQKVSFDARRLAKRCSVKIAASHRLVVISDMPRSVHHLARPPHHASASATICSVHR